MQLSTHFSQEQFERSQTATRLNIPNKMNAGQLSNATALCNTILEPIWSKIGHFVISSGFRSPELNKCIGGATNPPSQHLSGQAVDMVFPDHQLKYAFNKIIDLKIPFDQLIWENGEWIHISYSKNPRRQILQAVKENGKTVYKLISRI